jgi:tetratricopeptide (TPR) repeat protein
MRSQLKLRQLIKLGVFLLLVLGCSSYETAQINQALSYKKSGQFEDAIKILDKLCISSKDFQIRARAAQEAARIAAFDQKNYKKSAEYFNKVVLFSQNNQERLQAQFDLVSIYFNHLTDYESTIKEINKLLPLMTEPSERAVLRMNLARSYFYTNNFTQADLEANEITKSENGDIFQALILRGNIALTRKNLDKAAEYFKMASKENPEQAKKEKVATTLAVAYEEQKNFKMAIEILEQAKETDPEFIQIRINRLKERAKQQPGAKGLRK